MIDLRATYGSTYVIQDVPVRSPYRPVSFIPCDFGRIVVRGDRLAAIVRRRTLADRRLYPLPGVTLGEANGDTRVYVFAPTEFATVAAVVRPHRLPPPQARAGRQLAAAWP